MMLAVVVEHINPEGYSFAYRWHPHAVDPKVDYSPEPMTLVEFRLEETAGGTLLSIVESGFDRVPLARRAEAFRMNDGGWDSQLRRIERYVSASMTPGGGVSRRRPRSSRRSARRPGWRSSRGCALDGPLSIARLSEGTGVTRRRSPSTCTPWPAPGWFTTSAPGASGSGSSRRPASTPPGAASTKSSDQWDAAIARLQAFVEKPG